MISLDFSPIFRSFVFPILKQIGGWLGYAGLAFLAVSLYACVKYRFNPFGLTEERLRKLPIRLKLLDFIRWVTVDLIRMQRLRAFFQQYGLTLYCGRQGSGKTISMINYLNRIHAAYPKCIIVTNFDYVYANHIMTSWQDFFKYRNGVDGVVFALDEIHSEYSNAAWKDFPEDLLSEISQQRKQRIKIVASAQVFTRIAKPLREQCFSVVECRTFAKRWTFNREYDAWDYERLLDITDPKKKAKPFRKTSFIQNDFIRGCYDTYEKIKRLEKAEFLPRSQRAVER